MSVGPGWKRFSPPSVAYCLLPLAPGQSLTPLPRLPLFPLAPCHPLPSLPAVSPPSLHHLPLSRAVAPGQQDDLGSTKPSLCRTSPGPDMIPDPTGVYPGAVQGCQGQPGFLGARESHQSPAR